MSPTDFPEATHMALGNDYRSEAVESVQPMPIWADDEQSISCWRLTWRERIFVLLTGRIWASVLAGGKQPPISLSATSMFVHEAPK